jgi:hypothetical protein
VRGEPLIRGTTTRCALLSLNVKPYRQAANRKFPRVRDPFGPHEPANWQAAHNACNVEKGAKTA